MEVGGDTLWEPAAFDVVPGALLPHMRLPPAKWTGLETHGPATWTAPPLPVPPDGLCMIYAFMAALDPNRWRQLPLSPQGFIEDRFLEQTLKSAAEALLQSIVTQCRAGHADAAATWLEEGRNPGDEEFKFYAQVFRTSFLILPSDPYAFPVIHGDGPLGFAVQHKMSVDGAGHGAGHFELLKSWLPTSWEDQLTVPLAFHLAMALARDETPARGEKRGAPASEDESDCSETEEASGASAAAPPPAPPPPAPGPGPAPVRRRLRGKQAAPAYGPPPVGAAKKKPAARKSTGNPKRKGNVCPAVGCCFNTSSPGQVAALKNRELGTCMFCSRESCCKALATARGRGNMTRCLKKFYSFRDVKPEVLDRAFAQLEQWTPDHVEEFRQKAAVAKRSKPKASRAEARKQKEAGAEKQWAICKSWRKPSLMLTEAKALKAYRAAVLADQRWARKQFYPETPRRPRGAGDDLEAVVDNDCPLPTAFTSTQAVGLQRWCQEGSWGMCPNPECHLLQPRKLNQTDLKTIAQPLIAPSACRRCSKAKRPHMVPRPQDVPEELQNLSPEVVAALRPLDIDVGPEVRSGTGGYRKKVRMITFSWSLTSVDAKIRALQPKALRRSAKKALKYLLRLDRDNEYHDYYSRHQAFLVKHRDDPTPEQAKRPLHFIEEAGLETALWPHLYWKTTMCESFERLNDRRLQQLQGKSAAKPARQGSEDSSEEEGLVPSGSDSEAEAEPQAKQCIKRSFQTKLLSPLLGYGSDFELLQYVYDLHLWTDLGSKRNRAGDTKMRFMMKGHPMSPLYWENLKFGLFDVVRQLGFPDLYWTLAPWEPSYPYHQFMLDEMQKLLCSRTQLPALEAMHLAHTMLNTCRYFLAGHGKQRGEGWTQHLLGGKVPGYDVDNCISFFTRIEYQDGSKKEGTQRYHGSGRPHVHALFWLKDKAAARLEDSMAATLDLPAEQKALTALVHGSQRDWSGQSRWPVHAGPSKFDSINQELQLHHTQDDATEGVRGYFIPVLDALRCHQDAQIAQGRGLLLSYVTKYVAKWSDSSYNEWMSDSASVTSLCRKVLFEYHPNEPEMVLQLTGGVLFRQWDFGTAHHGVRSLRAPRPTSPEQPRFVEQYLASSWRCESMSLFEFLRKSNSTTGNVAGWLQKLWKAGSKSLSLKGFANRHEVQGEQAVAAEFLWRLNDHYYGQWCMMNVPFRFLKKFSVKNVEEKVPVRYRWLATALVLTDDARAVPAEILGYWRDPARIRRDMQHEAHSDAFIQDVQAFVSAQVLAIDLYLAGQLDRREEQQQQQQQQRPASSLHPALNIDFQGKQAVLHKLVAKRMELSLQAQRAPDEAAHDKLREDAPRKGHRPIVCSGRPGTGKTTVLHRNVRDALAAGGQVLVTIPTARQSTRMAAKLGTHERLVVETAAAAFQFHKPEQEALYAMYGYDLVVVDEFSQLSQEQFERILRMWRAADNLPALVFAGDKYQLPGIDPSRPWESPAWNADMVYFLELTEVFRTEDKQFLETLDLLRTCMPTQQQLNKICRGHKAWVGAEPSVEDIKRLMRDYPQAVMVAATKRGVALINQLALQALHPRAAPLATLPGAFEDNPDNYNRDGKLREDRYLAPAEVPIYRGIRLYLTRNVRKADDYVNGMPCKVTSFDEERQIIWVRTETGKRLPITRWHDPDHPGLIYFPIRLGYCTTVHKVQGDEFDFIIIYLDTPHMPALGYTAMSRVRNARSYLLGGVLTPAHFTPVTLR